MKTLSPENKLLIQMQASLDALFEPSPPSASKNSPAGQARWQRQDKFTGKYPHWQMPGFLPWKNPGVDAAEKKRISRAMNVLTSKGLTRVVLKEAGLTAAGMDAARRLIGRALLDDCLCGLDFIVSMTGTDHEWIDLGSSGLLDRGWFSEATMAGYDHPLPDGKPGEMRLPEESTLCVHPLVTLAQHGLVESGYQPNVEIPLWKLTERGADLAEQRRDSGTANPGAWREVAARQSHKWPVPVEIIEIYYAAFQMAESELEAARPLKPNMIAHGLSGRLYPDACLPKADRYFKQSRATKARPKTKPVKSGNKKKGRKA